jgi:hypothetical protein
MNDEKSLVETRQAAVADLASLSRVSHRLALIDTPEKLQQVLDKLLPRLLQRIGDNHKAQLATNDQILKGNLSKIHAKLVEMLSHTMKRVRDDKQCKLPCQAVLELLLETDTHTDGVKAKQVQVDPFTLNLSIAFLTLGLPRCTSSELEDAIPGLLALNGFYSAKGGALQAASTKSQWHQVTHLLFRAMELIIHYEEDSLKLKPSPTYSNSSKRLKPTETETEAPTPSSDAKDSESSMAKARQVLEDPQAAAAFYDFILDILLYQTVAGNIPPPGLSQAGHERLKAGHSATARDWAAEMAPRSKLCLAKTRFLDWIAPSRRWCLFLNDKENANANALGMTRTVALLIAAAGDSTAEVSQRAVTYLKQHFDSQRSQDDFGDPVILVYELLTLCVGGNNTQLALSSTSTSLQGLGLHHELSAENQQAVMSLRRRMISDSTYAVMANYVAKVLEDVPQFAADKPTAAGNIGTLAVLSCAKMLSNLRTSSGLTVLRGKQLPPLPSCLMLWLRDCQQLRKHEIPTSFQHCWRSRLL